MARVWMLTPAVAGAAGQIPVRQIDGRMIGDGARGPVTALLQTLYAQLKDSEAALGRGG